MQLICYKRGKHMLTQEDVAKAKSKLGKMTREQHEVLEELIKVGGTGIIPGSDTHQALVSGAVKFDGDNLSQKGIIPVDPQKINLKAAQTIVTKDQIFGELNMDAQPPKVSKTNPMEFTIDPNAEVLPAGMMPGMRPKEEKKEEKVEEKKPQTHEEMVTDFLDYVKGKFDNAPTRAHIDRWRHDFGTDGVFFMPFSETEIYIFRALKRGEYKQIISEVSRLRATTENFNEMVYMQERIVEKCILWPQASPEFMSFGKAGSAETLYQLIMAGSNFMDVNQALALVRRL